MIPIHVATKTITQPGPSVQIDCPHCYAPNVTATTEEITKQEFLYGALRVSTTRWTNVTCTACRQTFRVTPAPSALAAMNRQDASEAVKHGMSYVSFVTKFCIVLSIVLACLMFVGLLCAIVGIIGTRKARSRWRTAAFIGLALSIPATLAGCYFLFTAKQ